MRSLGLSHRQSIKNIRDSWEENTGERPDAFTADVILDNLCEAFFHSFTGAGAAYAVAGDIDTAQYLLFQWTGDDRRALKVAVLAKLDADDERVAKAAKNDERNARRRAARAAAKV